MDTNKNSQPTVEVSGKSQTQTDLREEVRHETGAEPPPRRAKRPSGSDALWLAITLLNLVLIIWLLPDSLIDPEKNKPLNLLIKILPITFGLFAAGYLWFKVRLRSFLKQTSYKITMTALMAVLLTLHISQLPFFPIYPQVQPPNARIEVDTKPAQLNNGRLFTTIKDHTVILKPPEGEDHGERPFSISYKDVFFGLFKTYSPRWSLLCKVGIATQDPDVEVVIEKTDNPFDDEFIRNPPAPWMKDSGTTFKQRGAENNVFVHTGVSNPSGGGDYIKLPYGQYKLTARKSGCTTAEQPLTIKPGGPAEYVVEFVKLCESQQ
jgi:hypothetical protein